MDAHERNPRRRLGRAMMICAMGLVAAVLYVLSIGPVLGLNATLQSRGFSPIPSAAIELVYRPILLIVDRGHCSSPFASYIESFDAPSDFVLKRARSLLNLAEEELSVGDLHRAQTLALKAHEYNAPYCLFEVQPEHIFATIRRQEIERRSSAIHPLAN